MDIAQGHILGVDAGQTSTKSILARPESNVALYRRGGAVDHFRQYGARRRNEEVIRDLVAGLCQLAKIESNRITAVAVGWTAVRPRTPEVVMVEEIFADLLPAARLIVLPDYVVSLAGASGGEPGIVVVAGGGSIAYGLAPDGRDAVVGGLGYLLGDEGSAYDIGRRAVAAAARSSDGRDRRTALEELIRETFELNEVRDITRLVYAEGFSRASLANLAPPVAALAGAGDVVAREIMVSAGQELGRAAVAVARRLGMVDPTIYTAGGVFSAGEIVLDPFQQVVQDSMPHAHVCPASYPPVVGALLLAHRLRGLSDDRTWLTAVAARCAEELLP
jgi:N-acetylglucosamine kinase-like BadF-type ATPase